MASNVVNVMVTLPADLADRMRAAKLKPSALLRDAVLMALDGADLGSFGARMDAVEKVLRAHSRQLREIKQTAERAENTIATVGLEQIAAHG